MKIYISGLYSGTNPQPGIGIARSLRTAYPEARLIGVEYSTRCSGIHWHDFDDIWLQRPWEEINLARFAREIETVLDSGALWISSIDLEIMWLGDVFPGGHPNLLTPPRAALEQTAKPAITAHEDLPVEIPAFVTTEISDWNLHAFCREHDWSVWLKGPYYEAVKTPSWEKFEETRNAMSSAWATDKLFLQKHVSGYEESIVLCAYRGELLDCGRMRKRDLTEINKTWAGDVEKVAPEIADALRKVVRRINWSGGAELEMVRDTDGKLWLLEWNPRFPAWIYGATITGFNLPARLVEGATGISAGKNSAQASEFTRVVLEIPVKPKYPLPPLPEPLAGKIGHSMKHPSGLLEFARRLHDLNFRREPDGGKIASSSKAAEIPATFIEDLSEVNFSELLTPAILFLERTAEECFRRAAQTAQDLSGEIKVSNAYSMKTNPDARLLEIARKNGFYCEGISLLEVKKATASGIFPGKIILNGPGKWQHKELLPNAPFHCIFCDSLEELNYAAKEIETGELETKTLGVRIRTPRIESRFGVPVETPDDFQKLVEAVKNIRSDTKFGVHFHMASSSVGVGNWWHLFESILRWCASLEALSGRLIEILDIGGGWFPEDLPDRASEKFRKAVNLVPNFLPNVREIIAEPGKALAQPSTALAMRILEIRRFAGGKKEAVVDGSIAELPMHAAYPHRILYKSGKWKSLRRGSAKLLGRLCMEQDIIAANVDLPETAKAGDILIFCDAGAYDRSMSYVFGRG